MTESTSPPEQSRIMDEVLGLGQGTDPFVAAVRATRMPMIITDPRQADNPVVFANDAFLALTGYSRPEILGRNCRFLQGPLSDPAVTARIREAVRAERSIEAEIRNHRKDGTAFWNRLLLAPVRDSHGVLAYFFASQLDVTLEKERLATLESDNAALVGELNHRIRLAQDSEARLRFATEAGQLGVWELDLRTRALLTSGFCRGHFGHAADAPITYDDVLRAIHEEDRARMVAAVDHPANHHQSRPGEYRIRRPDGQIGWVELRAQAVRDVNGVKHALAGTSLDITGRKRAEARRQALIDLDDRFRWLSDPSDVAYAVAEILGRTLNVSRAGYGTVDPVAETIATGRQWNMAGVRALEPVLHFRDFGTYIDDIKRGETVVVADVGLDPRTAPGAAALRAISAESFVNMPVIEADGLVALLFVNHAEARDWSAEEVSFLRDVASRTRDAVERRRAEDGLRTLAASLEQQVADRSEALLQAEASLRQSQKMEAVGQLTGGIAHDFNNLLTGISGSLDLLRTRVAQGRLQDVDRYVTAAQMAASRAAALTHRLLAFSRRQTLEPKVANVNRLVSGMEELVRRTVGPGIILEVVGASGLWNTLVDPGQLENALLNLCINARDAMPDGGRLTIETGNRWLDERGALPRDLSPGQYVTLTVSDTGTGMTPEVAAKAFDPFFTTKPIGQGTGLGLSMIYGFARQSGGQVQIYSEPAQGTQVSLYLPRHRGEAAEQAVSLPGPLAASPGNGETVLVVDDEPTIRMLVADVLAESALTAIEAEDGPAGLKVLQSETRVDLLVTDVGLPGGMNGRQVADAARALRPGLKVLFITGYAENAVLGHGHLEPGMHVLTKPFTMDALATKIRGLLAGD